MASLIVNAATQGRASMTHNQVLQFVARRKARDMAQRAYFAHVDPDGFAANFIAHQAGYRHPYSLAPTANSIESTGVRHQNNLSASAAAQVVFDAWMNSPSHRSHVLAGVAGYAEQTYYAVGYAYVSTGPFGFSSHYFVFVSAPPDPDAVFGPYRDWRFTHLTLTQMASPLGDADGDKTPDPFEYVFATDPLVANEPPRVTVTLDRQAGQLRISYPFRNALDPALVFGMAASSGAAPGGSWFWEPASFGRAGNVFSVPLGTNPGRFFRLTLPSP